MCHIATIQSSEDNDTIKMSPTEYTMTTTNNTTNHHIDDRHYSADTHTNIKYFVDLYTAALHLR
jgi:hypothetical protein